MVWGWIKKILVISLLLTIIIVGGVIGYNYSFSEQKKEQWQNLEIRLLSGLQRLQKENIDLWEANEVFQEIDKLKFPDNNNIPPKIIEITSKTMFIFGDILKDFTDKVLSNEIQLSDLEEEKLNTVAKVNHKARLIFNSFSQKLKPEEKQETESRFNFLEEEIEKERNRRTDNERNKDWTVYDFDKIPEFKNDPSLLEKWVHENTFTYGEIKRWLDIGINPNEYDFVHWIVEVKSREFISEELRTRYKMPSWLKDNNYIGDLRAEYLEEK